MEKYFNMGFEDGKVKRWFENYNPPPHENVDLDHNKLEFYNRGFKQSVFENHGKAVE